MPPRCAIAHTMRYPNDICLNIHENAAYSLDGHLVSAVVLTKECAMHEFLSERAAELARLAAMIRSGVDQAEAMIPPLNDQLSELAMLGITYHQVEGPSVYARPAGLSNDTDDAIVVFQAVLLMPSGIGATVWNGDDLNEYQHCSYCEQADLREKFLPYAKLPPIVRALLAKHASQMVGNLLRDMRILND